MGLARPAVRHLQGRGHARRRVAVPGRRWVTGEESRRLVHELRAASDAVAVGMGTVRADAPRLDARDVADAARPAAPARLRRAGRCPTGSELELRTGPLDGRAARARRRGRPVAAARRRADARRRRSSRPGSSTSCSSSSRPTLAGGDGADVPAAATILAHAVAPDGPAGRRGRAPRSLCPRTLTMSTTDSSAPTTRSSPCSRSG